MDKTERLLRMMEHPDSYTDDELQELLCDEECRELYEAMRLSASAFEAEDARQKIADGIKDEEWQKFVGNEELRIKNEEAMPQHHSSFFILHSSFYKLAAAFIGLLLISGIAYAAIRIVQDSGNGQTRTSADSVSVRVSPMQNIYPAAPSDTIPPMRIFENVPLSEMVSEIGLYYNKEVDIESQAASDLRLYYKWERKDAIESVVQDLNHFDRVNLSIEGDKLIVK